MPSALHFCNKIRTKKRLRGVLVARKLRRMVAEVEKRKPGRPRKFAGPAPRVMIQFPSDILEAAMRVQESREVGSFHDVIRELVREAAESRGLVKPLR